MAFYFDCLNYGVQKSGRSECENLVGFKQTEDMRPLYEGSVIMDMEENDEKEDS